MVKKKCNAIVHSVYMGDKIRMYYEKTDIEVYKGEEVSLARDITILAWKVVKLWGIRKWSAMVDSFTGREPSWPPHNLLCTCRKCNKLYSSYTKSLKG